MSQKLKFISDHDLYEAVAHLLDVAFTAKNQAPKKFGKNVIDPFSLLFEVPGFNLSTDEWIKSEQHRQSQKTLQNEIGTFHQRIIGSMPNWENLGIGQQIDVVNSDQKIIAEIKNKYNTVTGGNLYNVYESLDELVMNKASKYKDYTAYFVDIVPKDPKRYDEKFTPSNKKKAAKATANKLIRRIDGASFYDLASGQKNSLEALYDAIPYFIDKYINEQSRSVPVADKAFAKKVFEKAYRDSTVKLL